MRQDNRLASNKNSGTLYIVATPIGNIEDISARAIRTLQQVKTIYAEDTRHSQRLCQHYSIATPMQSLHEHNEEARITQVAEQLEQGFDLALISDAGTPLISDPGFKLVRGLRQQGFIISPVPGPSAIISALSVAGLATDSFSFWGFLPAKSSSRKQKFELLKNHTETLVFYESSHRIESSLEDALAILGTRQAVIGRELTKTFETILSADLATLLENVSQDNNQRKGEFVLMIEGNREQKSSISLDSEQLLLELIKDLAPNKAAKLVAKLTGANKKDLYNLAVSIKNDQ